MLTHRSQTSTTIYAHRDVEDLRGELERTGMLGIGRPASRVLAAVPAAGERSSWERPLLEAVRAEFRREVFVAPVGSSLLGGWVRRGWLHRLWAQLTVGRGTKRASCGLHGDRWRGAAGDRGLGGARQAAAGTAPSSGMRGRGLPTVLAPWWAMRDA
jgi:hypothetical protein